MKDIGNPAIARIDEKHLIMPNRILVFARRRNLRAYVIRQRNEWRVVG